MNQELIQSLSVITEEEQKILGGSSDIDRTLYMDRGDMVIDSDKLLEAGQLITIRPHTLSLIHILRGDVEPGK